ncbi:MAG: arylsulfatase [Blastocatellia bacterium]|nr:arylsulfatase [Blastocatellia bacterium]
MKIRRIVLVFLMTAVCGLNGGQPESSDSVVAAQAGKPNIIVILADDLGYSDLSCYGGEISTPNLDGLARGGLRFTQFYNAARCCPTRAALLTGLYPHQAGVGMMTADAGEKFPGYRGAIRPYAVTLAEALKSAGYRTAMSGKWHVGDNLSPIERGFDDFYGFTRGYAVDSFDERMMIRLPAGKPRRAYSQGEYFATDAITDHALDFVADMRRAKQPYFLYVAYQAPHFPVQSRAEDAAPYARTYDKGWDTLRAARLARMKRLGAAPKDTPLSPRSRIHLPDVARRLGSMTEDGNNPPWDSLSADRRADLAGRMKAYAGMVAGMDRNIGRLIEDLKRRGELDDTLILFLSDNGACAEWEPFGFDMNPPANVRAGTGIGMGTPGLPNRLHSDAELRTLGQGTTSLFSYGSAWANLSNTPWRLYKHYSHEGGISSPLIVHWPRGVKTKGQWRNQPGHIIDVMATLVDLAGAVYPTERAGAATPPLEGVSLRPAFANQPLARRAPLFFEHDGSRAVRDGAWKLVAMRGGEWELYNIETDRAEMKNLAAKHPDKVAALATRWNEWAARTNVLPRPGR